MQVIGVGERRYFNGYQEMVIILMGPDGLQIDLPASPEQVGTLLEVMEPPAAVAPPAPPPAPAPELKEPEQATEQAAEAAPTGPPTLSDFAASMLDGDGEEVEEPIRLARTFVPVEDDGSPL